MGIADAFVETVLDGPLLLAMPVAAAAGLVSFLSPCVLPLVPGYLSYVTGLSGQELGDERPRGGTPAAEARPRLSDGRSAPTGRDGTSPEGRNSPWQP